MPEPGPWRFLWEKSWLAIGHSRGMWKGVRTELGKRVLLRWGSHTATSENHAET